MEKRNIGLILAHRHIREEPTMMTDEHCARLEAGLRLYEEGRVQKLVVTCSHVYDTVKYGSPAIPYWLWSQIWLVIHGVPASDILAIEKSRMTVEEAFGFLPITHMAGLGQVPTVTSDYHMDRAKKIFGTGYPNIEFVPHEVPIPDGPVDDPAVIEKQVQTMLRWRKALEDGTYHKLLPEAWMS